MIWFFLFFSFSANAKDIYTWDKVVKVTFDNSPELVAAHAQVKSSEFQKTALYSEFMPKFSASLGYSDNELVDLNNFTTSGENYSFGLEGSINLFAGFRDRARVDQAQANLVAARAKYDLASSKVLYDLRAAFENFTFAKSSRELSEEIVKRREENYRIVELRFESGHENKGSLLLSKAYLAQAKYDVLQAKNNEEVAKFQLLQVMGLDSKADFDIVGDIPLSPPPKLESEVENYIFEIPDYKQAVAEEKASEKAVTVTESNFYPSLNLTGQLRKNGPDFFPEETRQTAFGITLTIPLFDGGKDYYGRKAAVQNLVSNRSTVANLKRTLLTNLKRVHASYIEALAKFEADALFKDAVEVRAMVARSKYNNGLLTFENWDIIENDLITRQNSYLQSKRARSLAEGEWYRLLGRGME